MKTGGVRSSDPGTPATPKKTILVSSASWDYLNPPGACQLPTPQRGIAFGVQEHHPFREAQPPLKRTCRPMSGRRILLGHWIVRVAE